MSELFNRCLYVEIADENGNGQKFYGRTINNPDGFDIQFSINKTSEKEPNESSVTIYNLNEDTRRKLENNYIYVTLYAGYNEEYKLLALGNIATIKNSYSDATISTQIIFEDSSSQYEDSRILKTFPAGTKYSKIIKDIANSMGYPDPLIKSLDDSATIKHSQTLSGSSAKYLKEYCYKMGVKYSIQNNKLIIKKEDDAITGNAFIVSEDTGLVGGIEQTLTKIHKKYKKTRKPLKKPTEKAITRRNQSIAEATSKFNQKEREKEATLNFQMLLIPELIPGSYLQIETLFFPKAFAIIKDIEFNGSNSDNEYYANITALRI